MAKWDMVRLGDVCSKGSSNIAQKELEGNLGEYPIYGASGFIKKVDFYKQSQEYIAIVKDGAGVGRTMILPAKSSIIGTLQYIFPQNNVVIQYLYYALVFMNLGKYFTGAAIPHIYFKDYQNEKLPLPPLEEQKNIAAELDKIQGIIAKRKTQLEKLDILVKAKFVEMFGDPVTNPMGWENVTIRDVASEVKYGTSSPATTDGKYIYLRMNNITYGGQLDLSSLKYIDVPDNDIEKYIVRKGDILFNRTNSKELVGKTCVFKLDTPMIIAGYIIRVRTNKRANPEYISAVLNSNHGKKTLFEMCKSIVGQANINAQELQNIKLFIPPIELQNQFAEYVQEVENLKSTMHSGLEKLELLYNSKMQEYFG